MSEQASKKPDKVSVVLESSKSNEGKRTVIQSTLAGGATVPPHYHTKFDETFKVVEGEVTVWSGESKSPLKGGQSATIKKNTVHSYQVESAQVVVNIVLEPGDLSFENAMKIIVGSQQDGVYAQLSTLEQSNHIFMAVISELTDTNFAGNTQAEFEHLSLLTGKDKIEQTKNEFIEKYCN